MQCPLWIWIYLWLFLAPCVAVLESKAQILYPPLRLRHNKSRTVVHQTLRKWLTDLHTLFSPPLSWLLGAPQIPLSPSKVSAVRCLSSHKNTAFACSASAALLHRLAEGVPQQHTVTRRLCSIFQWWSDPLLTRTSDTGLWALKVVDVGMNIQLLWD